MNSVRSSHVSILRFLYKRPKEEISAHFSHLQSHDCCRRADQELWSFQHLNKFILTTILAADVNRKPHRGCLDSWPSCNGSTQMWNVQTRRNLQLWLLTRWWFLLSHGSFADWNRWAEKDEDHLLRAVGSVGPVRISGPEGPTASQRS